MTEFKAVINDPRDGKTYQTVVTGHHANSLIGRKIGDEFDGIFVGLPGYKLLILGGSDTSGFPMKPEIPGSRRRRILLSKSIGFKPTKHGQRKKKMIRGNTISAEMIQINMKITAFGSKPLDLLTSKEEKK